MTKLREQMIQDMDLHRKPTPTPSFKGKTTSR